MVPPMGSAEVWLGEDEAGWGTLSVAPNPAEPGKVEKTVVETELGDYRLYYANVRDAVNGVGELAVSAEAGFETIRALELARVSSKEGRSIAF